MIKAVLSMGLIFVSFGCKTMNDSSEVKASGSDFSIIPSIVGCFNLENGGVDFGVLCIDVGDEEGFGYNDIRASLSINAMEKTGPTWCGTSIQLAKNPFKIIFADNEITFGTRNGMQNLSMFIASTPLENWDKSQKTSFIYARNNKINWPEGSKKIINKCIEKKLTQPSEGRCLPFAQGCEQSEKIKCSNLFYCTTGFGSGSCTKKDKLEPSCGSSAECERCP